ncbi:hypothetical protein [Telluria beijingensis]|uniref:hypothetical protein n=1 Tax=Telluria beijingensis TaxID=3068633 RepID=UPI002795CD6C|nr:hypothetical protein [Massilia sp. REN29]
MQMKAMFAFAAAALIMSGGASACQDTVPKVAVHFAVGEQAPERVEAAITNPVEKLLADVPRRGDLYSSTSHGVVDIELHFDGGATERDLAAVKARLDGWRSDKGIDVISTRITLTTACLSKWPWSGEVRPGSMPRPTTP